MSYGQKIREIRRRELLSQEAFAERVGVSRSVISQIEIDRINPTLDTLKKIAEEFNVSIDFLMRGEKGYDQSEEEERVFQKNYFSNLSAKKDDTRHHWMKWKHTINFANEARTHYAASIRNPSILLKEIPFIWSDRLRAVHRVGLLDLAKIGDDSIQLPLPDTLDLVAVQLDESYAPGNDGLVVISSPLPINAIQRRQRLLVLTVDHGLLYGDCAFADDQRLIIEGREVLTSSIRECWKVEWEIRRVG